MISVHKGVAHPWQCDVLGHMTTRYYVGMFDDASYHFLYEIFGWVGASDELGKLGWVDVNHNINYQTEVRAGDLLEIRAVLTKIGTKSIQASYQMQNLQRGDVAATLDAVYVLFDLDERKSVAIDDNLRALATHALGGADNSA
jgi:acyl-CoA thioester hydrolase